MGEQQSMALVTGSSPGPQGTPQPRHHAGHGDLSPRTRGSPRFDEALVGTYLKSLPDDGSADRIDETVPIVK